MTGKQRQSTSSRRDFLRTAGTGTAMALAGSRAQGAANRDGPLPQRPLGNTGQTVPILGIGTGPAGRRSRREAANFFSACLDAGGTYFDTAQREAGYGVAQAALGDVLKTRRAEAFVVTKCWEPDGEKALKLLRSNLHELNTDHADLVYAHAIGSDRMVQETVMGKGGVLDGLAKAQRDGLTRFIGISGHCRPGRFLQIIRHFDIQVMMNAVNFVCRHIYNFEEDVWPEAHRKGIGLAAMKIYGGGDERRGGRIQGADVYPAFRYAQSIPHVSTVVAGMYDEQEFKENMAFAREYTPLSSDELASLLARGKTMAAEWKEPFGPVV